MAYQIQTFNKTAQEFDGVVAVDQEGWVVWCVSERPSAVAHAAVVAVVDGGRTSSSSKGGGRRLVAIGDRLDDARAATDCTAFRASRHAAHAALPRGRATARLSPSDAHPHRGGVTADRRAQSSRRDAAAPTENCGGDDDDDDDDDGRHAWGAGTTRSTTRRAGTFCPPARRAPPRPTGPIWARSSCCKRPRRMSSGRPTTTSSSTGPGTQSSCRWCGCGWCRNRVRRRAGRRVHRRVIAATPPCRRRVEAGFGVHVIDRLGAALSRAPDSPRLSPQLS